MLISYVPFDGTSGYIEDVVSLSHELCEEGRTSDAIRAQIINDADEEGHKGWIALCKGQVVGYAYGYQCVKKEVKRMDVEVIGEQYERENNVYDCFEYVEMAVSEKYKHAGIESTLEKRLLDETSTLERESSL
ncbi:hypothetical protein N780_10340 [Pontibacillus chungwhensis BH030062]|uniref:N-acetyltransferase domain-containing protein n=1 Tax=Pontibacillus chungwhensis BH030062 TaxID=1385513 RepID=A0A0A2UT20_9BACI|nr:hypothetical protein [Pontibacillus chungwhensis]KGP89656.1 hypothetical protein N780_10340 [Pontibacillus chungwhensis BH030062]